MSDATRRLLIVALSVLSVALFAGALYAASPRAPAPVPARPPPPAALPPAARQERPLAPDFTLERLDGSRVTLSALRGKVVVIDFWATWCPPCRAEMPWLVDMAKRLESRGVVFVAIDEDDPPGQVPLVRQFAQEVPGLERFAVLGNPDIETQYGVRSLPTLFVVDREGRIAERFVGQAEEETVLQAVVGVAMK